MATSRGRSSRQAGVAIVDAAGVLRRYPGPVMVRTPFEELLHRVNNLLGTIEIQAEVAAADDTVEAYRAAMALIVASARRTGEDVLRLRAPRERGS
jgi:hypothetical protein